VRIYTMRGAGTSFPDKGVTSVTNVTDIDFVTDVTDVTYSVEAT